jgi:hypothetical protein
MTLTQITNHNPGEENGVSTLEVGKYKIYMHTSEDCTVAGVKHLDIKTALKFAGLLSDEDTLKANGFKNLKRICDVKGYARCLELFVPGLLLNKKEQEIRLLLPERHTHVNYNKETITIC